MSDRLDAIIIGAGIIGCGIAYGLAGTGRRVLALDKNPAAGYGSTSSSAAVIRTYYSTLAGCSLAWEGLHYWCDWAGFLGAADDRELARFVECPSLFLRNGDPDGLEGSCVHLDALGIRWEAWNLERLSATLPGFDFRKFAPPRRPDDPLFGGPTGKTISGALYFPDSGYVTDPQLAARNLQKAAEDKGARFRFGAKVTDVVVEGGRAAGVALAGEDGLRAPVVINAAGPYSAIVNRMAGADTGMNVGTRPLRQELCHVPAPADTVKTLEGGAAGYLIADPDVGTYSRPEVGRSLLIGSMEPACDTLEWVDDPDDFQRSHTEQWTAQVYRQALRMPSLGIPGQAAGLVDLYDVSDDWIPIYDKSDLPGFYMAVGTSGNQFKNGPVAGQLMAGLIDYCEAGHDPDRDPFMFPLAYTGGSLDTSAFSRRRTVNPDSSMSVLG